MKTWSNERSRLKDRFQTHHGAVLLLVRFGDYWVAADGEIEYHLHESAHQQKALMTELEAGGYWAFQHGFKLDTLFEQHGTAPDFTIFAHDGPATTRHRSRKLGFFFTEWAEESGRD